MMDEKELKKEDEIERNKRGIYRVKNIKRNSKIIDLVNLGEVILNLESVSKKALIRLFSTDLTYYLNEMEKNEEIKATKITTIENQGGDKVYFYQGFDKQLQSKSEMLSYFTYYLTQAGIIYGKITVNQSSKITNIPFILENEGEIIRYETEIHAIPSYLFSEFTFEKSYDKLPVFIVDDLLNMEAIANKCINCLIILIERFGRDTEVMGVYVESPIKKYSDKDINGNTKLLEVKPGKIKVFRNNKFTRCLPKYQKTLETAQSINSFKRPYIEAERRATDVKSRIYSKK